MAQTCDADENVAFIEKRAGRMEICMKKILHLIFGRFFVVAMAIILQVLWLCVVLWQLSYKFTYVNLLVRVFNLIVADFWTYGIFLMWKIRSDQTYKRENGCCQPSGGSIVSER